jgi:pyrroloquinoline quinone (PQQ) biosynthesis protein C
MSFFIRLIETTDEERRALERVPKVDRMIHKGLGRDEYRDFLLDLYPIVWHFCPIMAAAAARCGDDYRQVRLHLYANIDEEKGHEQWILDDLRAIGGDPEEAARREPCAPVQAFVGYNYYCPEHVHPATVIGMLYSLEVVSSVYGGRVAHSIARSLEMEGPHGFTFLQSHASMDVDHMAKLNQLIKGISDPRVQDAIVNVTKVNFYLLKQFMAQ